MFPPGAVEVVLGHLKIYRFFYRTENDKGQQKDLLGFHCSQRLKKKVLQSLEKRTVYLISLKGREMTASMLSEQCKIPEQGSMNLS